jgi:hypothetical protein
LTSPEVNLGTSGELILIVSYTYFGLLYFVLVLKAENDKLPRQKLFEKKLMIGKDNEVKEEFDKLAIDSEFEDHDGEFLPPGNKPLPPPHPTPQ